jgi:quercetin dioxygenase-like cupin family protein
MFRRESTTAAKRLTHRASAGFRFDHYSPPDGERSFTMTTITIAARSIRSAIGQIIVALALVAAGVVTATAESAAAPPEPQPVTLPCATDMSVQMLGAAQPADAEGQALVLVRAFFGVGGGIGPHTHPGTLVVSVESGSFGVTLEEESDMEMTVMRSGDAGTPAAAEPLSPGQEAVLNPGDWFIETGMIHSARTVGDEPVTVTFTGLVAAGQPVTACVA